MTHILVYTIPNSPGEFFISIDNELDLPAILDKMSKIGDGRTVKLYSVTPVNYKLNYKDKIETITTKIPEIEILK